MANINTNVMDSFVAGARIRTLNYRGSLVSTQVVTPNMDQVIAVDDLIYLCPIPYRSIIRSIRIGCSYTGGTQAIFALTICGIQKDRKTIGNEIGFQTPIANIFTTAAAPLMTEKVTQTIVGQTLISNLGTFTANGAFTPKAEFIPYQEDRLGVLALKCTTPSAPVITAGTISVIVDYVENAPSDGPFLKTLGLTATTV
jgi:hypothetical protein